MHAPHKDALVPCTRGTASIRKSHARKTNGGGTHLSQKPPTQGRRCFASWAPPVKCTTHGSTDGEALPHQHPHRLLVVEATCPPHVSSRYIHTCTLHTPEKSAPQLQHKPEQQIEKKETRDNSIAPCGENVDARTHHRIRRLSTAGCPPGTLCEG